MGSDETGKQFREHWLAIPLTTQADTLEVKKFYCMICIWLTIQLLISGCKQVADLPISDSDSASSNTKVVHDVTPNSPTWTPDSYSNPPSNPTIEAQPMQSGIPDEKIFTLGQATETPQNNLFPLVRPILPPGRITIDPSYRFGSTQNGEREPHHGVEFINSFGTPVVAAADGTVIFAGNDTEQVYGPFQNFYGMVVILEHDLPGFSQPIFTLYAHLSTIHVKEDAKVQAGQIIGEVGLSGIALGSHLHFEVRYAENHYDSVRNPELWLQPLDDEKGKPKSAIAGLIVNEANSPLFVSNITLSPIPETKSESSSSPTFFLESTYADPFLNGREPWEENFAIGNLPPGKYQISFVQNGLQKQVVEVESGEIAFVKFRIGETVP